MTPQALVARGHRRLAGGELVRAELEEPGVEVAYERDVQAVDQAIGRSPGLWCSWKCIPG